MLKLKINLLLRNNILWFQLFLRMWKEIIKEKYEIKLFLLFLRTYLHIFIILWLLKVWAFPCLCKVILLSKKLTERTASNNKFKLRRKRNKGKIKETTEINLGFLLCVRLARLLILSIFKITDLLFQSLFIYLNSKNNQILNKLWEW